VCHHGEARDNHAEAAQPPGVRVRGRVRVRARVGKRVRVRPEAGQVRRQQGLGPRQHSRLRWLLGSGVGVGSAWPPALVVGREGHRDQVHRRERAEGRRRVERHL